MTFPSEYHVSVKRLVQQPIPASGLLGIFLLPLLLVSFSSAQHESVSSAPSSSGHSFSASAPSSGASTHSGYAPSHSEGITISPGHSHSSNASGEHHHHHPNSGTSTDAYYPYVYPVLIPYVDDSSADANDDGDDEYQGGPTIFDRRGSGADSYIPPTYEGPAHAHPTDASTENASSNFASEPQQPPTTLVFKDGHQLEIENYAIVSQTLYDLTPGHPRKIALADLDLPSTQKQNDDHGITFELPSSSQAN